MGLLGKLRRSDAGSTPVTVPPAAAAKYPDGCRPVLSAQALLAPHEQELRNIRQHVGVPDAHWNALYQPLLERFATFVQQLPASEAHHHRQPGGLLAHALDTALKALTIRRGVLLPANASTEVLAEKQDVWTYATVSAALIHDLGKPVVDQTITRYDASGEALGPWNPLAGPMRAPTTDYALQYVRGRRYRLHPRLPPMLVQYLVPSIALDWMVRDLDVFEAWLATISGGDAEIAGELGQIIKQADGLSVAADLAGGSVPTVEPGVRRSLAERMATALRKMIDDRTLPLNKPGAAGFVIGEDLWLVSKRVLDALRDALSAETPAGVPSRNERLMDELQAHGILMANGDRAIWNATVELPDWQYRLSLLRIPLLRLWSDPEARPPCIAGRVLPDSAEPPAESVTAPAADIAAPASKPEVSLPESPSIPSMPSALDESSASYSQERPVDPKRSDDIHPLRDNEVIRWLINGISSGRLKLNTPDARLHTTHEGLLLVSPGIFRDFAGVDGWLGAQKRLLKRKAHLKTPAGTNIWTYRVVGERKSQAQLKGVVLPDAGALLSLHLPSPNAHLMLLPPPAAPDPAERGDSGSTDAQSVF